MTIQLAILGAYAASIVIIGVFFKGASEHE